MKSAPTVNTARNGIPLSLPTILFMLTRLTKEKICGGCLPFGHVPHPDGFVLGVGEDEFLARVEENGRHVVIVTATCVHFPALRLCNTELFVYFMAITDNQTGCRRRIERRIGLMMLRALAHHQGIADTHHV